MAQQAMAEMSQLVERIQGALGATAAQLEKVTSAYGQLQGRYAALETENVSLRAQLSMAGLGKAGGAVPVLPTCYAAPPGPTASPHRGGRTPRDEEILSLRQLVTNATVELMAFENVTSIGGMEPWHDPTLDSTQVLADKDMEIQRLQRVLTDKNEALREWQQPHNEDALLDLEIERLHLLLRGVTEALCQYENVSKLGGGAANGRPTDETIIVDDKDREVARLREAIVAKAAALQQWRAPSDCEDGGKDIEIARLRLLLKGIADALAQYERVSKIEGEEPWEDFDLDPSRVLHDRDKEIERLRQAIDAKTKALRDWQAHLSVDHWDDAEIARLRGVLEQKCLEIGRFERVSKHGDEDTVAEPSLDPSRVLGDKEREINRLQKLIDAKEQALQEWREG